MSDKPQTSTSLLELRFAAAVFRWRTLTGEISIAGRCSGASRSDDGVKRPESEVGGVVPRLGAWLEG